MRITSNLSVLRVHFMLCDESERAPVDSESGLGKRMKGNLFFRFYHLYLTEVSLDTDSLVAA